MLKKTEIDDGTAAFSDISLGKANIFPEQPLDQGIRLYGYKLCFQQTLRIQNLIKVVILPGLTQCISSSAYVRFRVILHNFAWKVQFD